MRGVRDYVTLPITKDSIEPAYLAAHGKDIARIVNTGKALVSMMDAEEYKW